MGHQQSLRARKPKGFNGTSKIAQPVESLFGKDVPHRGEMWFSLGRVPRHHVSIITQQLWQYSNVYCLFEYDKNKNALRNNFSFIEINNQLHRSMLLYFNQIQIIQKIMYMYHIQEIHYRKSKTNNNNKKNQKKTPST